MELTLPLRSSRGIRRLRQRAPEDLPPIVGLSISLRKIALRSLRHLLSQQFSLVPGLMRIQRRRLSVNRPWPSAHCSWRGWRKCLRAARQGGLWKRSKPGRQVRSQSPAPNAFELLFLPLAREYSAPRKLVCLANPPVNARPDMEDQPVPAAIRRPRYASPPESPPGISDAADLGRTAPRALDHLFGRDSGSRAALSFFADLPASVHILKLEWKTAHRPDQPAGHAPLRLRGRGISRTRIPMQLISRFVGGQMAVSARKFHHRSSGCLWQRGEYVALPLNPSSAAEVLRHRTFLLPRAKACDRRQRLSSSSPAPAAGEVSRRQDPAAEPKGSS